MRKETLMSRTYYTLRKHIPGKIEDDIYKEYGKVAEYDSYEAAYDKMVRLYLNSLTISYDNPDGLPIRYGIWQTSVHGNNSMTQAVWR